MRKKILSGLLCAAMAASLCACNKSDQKGDDALSNSEPVTSAAGESSSEKSNAAPEGKNIYDLTAYEGEDVFNIEKQELGSAYEGMCDTYEIYYRSDGFDIKAYICIPSEKISSQEKCRAMIYCRGGHYNYGALDYEKLSYMCGVTGRIVAACEIRGDNGSCGSDQFGGDEMHDVYRLIDLLDKHFSFVDMEDLCVMGVSRGGMTAYMAARDDKRIKKIIVCSGISDLLQAYKEREDMQQLLRDCIGGSPEEKPEEYKKRSALYWSDEIKIPVLIVHSRKDQKTVYETQAEKIYEKLKDSTDCTIITHDDDYHGIHTEDIPAITEWINKSVS